MSLSRMFRRTRRWQLFIIGFVCVLLILKMLNWNNQTSFEAVSHFRDSGQQDFNKFGKKQPISLQKISGRTGLTIKGDQFFLDKKPITIISGAIHYFRFPHQYWRDRLEKMKACGLNTIETYMPWNKHEPEPGKFDFSGNLNITKFLLLAKELGFMVLLRPGPYICSEWEFGGLPAWLLRDPSMQVRTLYPNFIDAVKRYLGIVLPLVGSFQYKIGGPIVAMQLDNEYGAYFKDEEYIPFLKKLFESHNVNELFFVSDNIEGLQKQTVPGVLKTVNFKYVKSHFNNLSEMQPNAPLMVMEFWTGWFDWWGDKHHTLTVQEFGETLNEILSIGASVNFYMFYGGTNFGFMNGGYREQHMYKSDITSYDYDALISENGDLTSKYYKAKAIIAHYYRDYIPNERLFTFTDKFPRKAYKSILATEYIPIWETLSFIQSVETELPVSMEMLNINSGAGQAYGYTLYRALVNTAGKATVEIRGFNHVHDRGILFIDSLKKLFIDNTAEHATVVAATKENAAQVMVDLLVENGGRVNWMEFNDQRKGLLKTLTLDNQDIKHWSIFPFEMKLPFINQLLTTKWTKIIERSSTKILPGFFKFLLQIDDQPLDTYIDMTNWGKGVVFVNGENLGRYWSIGPQKSLYLPAPWLHLGDNYIVVFEEEKAWNEISFNDEPSLG